MSVNMTKLFLENVSLMDPQLSSCYHNTKLAWSKNGPEKVNAHNPMTAFVTQ